MRTPKLTIDPRVVAEARGLARQAGQPIVEMARSHTTVSVERAVLRLAGLSGADPDGMPLVNHVVDAVRAQTGLEQRCIERQDRGESGLRHWLMVEHDILHWLCRYLPYSQPQALGRGWPRLSLSSFWN